MGAINKYSDQPVLELNSTNVQEGKKQGKIALHLALITGAAAVALAAVGSCFLTIGIGPIAFAAVAIVGATVALLAIVAYNPNLFKFSFGAKEHSQKPALLLDSTQAEVQPKMQVQDAKMPEEDSKVNDASAKLKVMISELEEKYEGKIAKEKWEHLVPAAVTINTYDLSASQKQKVLEPYQAKYGYLFQPKIKPEKAKSVEAREKDPKKFSDASEQLKKTIAELEGKYEGKMPAEKWEHLVAATITINTCNLSSNDKQLVIEPFRAKYGHLKYFN